MFYRLQRCISHTVPGAGASESGEQACRVLLRTIFLVQASASPWSFTWKKGVMENSLGRVSKCPHPIHQGSTHTVYLTHKGTPSLEVRISTYRHTDWGEGVQGKPPAHNNAAVLTPWSTPPCWQNLRRMSDLMLPGLKMEGGYVLKHEQDSEAELGFTHSWLTLGKSPKISEPQLHWHILQNK